MNLRPVLILMAMSLYLTSMASGDWFSGTPTPDIAIDRIELLPSVPYSGESFQARVFVINKTTSPLEMVKIRYSYTIMSTGICHQRGENLSTVKKLDPSHHVIEISVDGHLKAGEYYLNVGPLLLEGNLKKREQNLADNTRIKEFMVAVKPLPPAPPKPLAPAPPAPPAPIISRPIPITVEVPAIRPSGSLWQLREKARFHRRRHEYVISNEVYDELLEKCDKQIGKLHNFTMVSLREYADLAKLWDNFQLLVKLTDDRVVRYKALGRLSQQLLISIYQDALLIMVLKMRTENPETEIPYLGLVGEMIEKNPFISLGIVKTHYSHLGYAYAESNPSKVLEIMSAYMKLYDASTQKRKPGTEMLCEQVKKACKKLRINHREYPLYRKMKAIRDQKKPSSIFSGQSQLYQRAITQFNDDEDPAAAYESMAKAVKMANFEDDDSACIHYYSLFARICKSLKKYDEMERYYLHMISFTNKLEPIREGDLSSQAAHQVIAILNAYSELAHHYRGHENNPKKGWKLLKKSYNLVIEHHDENTLRMADYYEKIANYLHWCKQNQKAKKYYIKSRDINSRLFGPDSDDVKMVQDIIDKM